jgi:hypothetical protein
MAHEWGRADAEKTRAALARWAESAGTGVKRAAPKSPAAQARFLRDSRYGGSTRRMADAYGVTQRTIERWISGSRRNPAARDRLAEEVREIRQGRAKRRQRKALRRGVPPPAVKAKAWMGPNPATSRGIPVGTDTKRLRTMPAQDLSPEALGDLLGAAESGDDRELHAELRDVFGDYFAGGHNRQVRSADVGEVDWIEFE